MKTCMRNLMITLSAVGLAVANTHAGTFGFAEGQENPDLILHPIGYTGDQNVLEISVCIATDSENPDDLEIPVQNAVSTWNNFEPRLDNVTSNDPELGTNEIDVESVLVHELGHCNGLGHPNLATESDLGGSDEEFAKTLQGPNSQYDVNNGSDNVIGTSDDLRGDDINLNWFRINENDPFLFEATIDPSTYSTDITDLPGADSFVEIARFEVSQHRGHGDGEAVMFQGTHLQETQRDLHHDDATTIRIGMAGDDETQGTGDDYVLEMTYGGIADGCDITIEMTGNDIGACQASGNTSGLSANHWHLNEGTITLGSTDNFNWFFNTEATGDVVFQDRFE